MAFIVLEGLDGAGKSTQIRQLLQWLDKNGKVTKYIHFPRFDTPVYGDLIARFLRGELGSVEQVNPYLVALMYAGDRKEAAELIRQWLREEKVVVVDRYVTSNIAYQCAKLDSDEDKKALREWILQLEYDEHAIPEPDITLFLDVPFAFTQQCLAKNRKGDDREYLQGKNDIHEASIDLQKSVRQVYINEAEHDPNFHVITCSDKNSSMLTADQTFEKIRERLAPVMNLK